MARQSKDISQKHQAILSKLLKDDDNKYCVDCDAKGPRWASWNLGVFLCIRCAGIHRNLGVHISKVKSINLDSWTAEQIASIEDMGNSRARAVYEANLPDHYKRPNTSDSSMEQFIRAKYEHKKYIAKEWVPPKPRSVPAHYYDTEEPKKETRKPKTVLTIPGAAAGTTAAIKTEKKTAAPVKVEASSAPSLMVDVSSPPSQVPNTKPQTTSSELLADLFSSAPAAAPSTAASEDLFGLSSGQQPAQSSGDNSEDLFKVADEKTQTAKDSIMALFGNNTTPAQPNMMQNTYNMGAGGYPQSGTQPHSSGGLMYSMQPQGQMPGNMMGGYSMAGQHPNMMMSSQTGMYQQPQMGINQQQMMGQQQMMPPQQMMPQQMMGGVQPMPYANPQMQQQMYTQQMQAQMANMTLNQQQMTGMPKQGATAATGASWGNTNGQANGQTLNGALWN